MIKANISTEMLADTILNAGLVEALTALNIARDLLHVTLDGGCHFTLTGLGRLFVKFATADFGQYTGFFTGAFEATQCDVKGLIFSYSNTRH
jgi:hypothetical protein